VGLVTTDVSEERIISIISVTRNGKLGITLANVGPKNIDFWDASRLYQLQMSSRNLYHVALVRTEVSENILPPSSRILSVIRTLQLCYRGITLD
jgi:hypothetical protein